MKATIFPRKGQLPLRSADLAAVTVVVCATCRDVTGSDAHPRAGAILARNTQGCRRRRGARPPGRVPRQLQAPALSAAILREDCWSYVFGDLSTDKRPRPDGRRKALRHLDRRADALARPARFASSAASSRASLPSTRSRTSHDRFARPRSLHRRHRLSRRRQDDADPPPARERQGQAAGDHRQRVRRCRHRRRDPQGLRRRSLP